MCSIFPNTTKFSQTLIRTLDFFISDLKIVCYSDKYENCLSVFVGDPEFLQLIDSVNRFDTGSEAFSCLIFLLLNDKIVSIKQGPLSSTFFQGFLSAKL